MRVESKSESKYEYRPRHDIVYSNACWLYMQEDSDRNDQ